MRSVMFVVSLSIFLFSCNSKENLNRSRPAEVAQRQAMWHKASRISSEKTIYGKWKAVQKGMPGGSRLVEWSREFREDGSVVESMATADEATGPVFYYKVRDSMLYLAEDQNNEAKKEGELRVTNSTLLLKRPEGIYVFHRQR